MSFEIQQQGGVHERIVQALRGKAELSAQDMSTERLYMVYLKGGEPGDRAYQQPTRAASGETVDDYLVFLHVDGSLAGLFISEAVLNWKEISEDELSK